MNVENEPIYANTAGSLSQIQTLPNELLSAIFRAGSQSKVASTFGLPFPLLVSKINRHWRAVALNSPNIWCNIQVWFVGTRSIKWMQLWLERSKSCLVDITFIIPPRISSIIEITDDHVDQSLQASIKCHAHRWRRLIIYADSIHSISGVIGTLDHSLLSCLQEFHLHLRRAEHWQDVHAAVFVNAKTLSLRSLKLCRSCFTCLPNFTNLTYLEITRHFPDLHEFRGMILASPGLTHLVIRDSVYVQISEDVEPVQAPSLRFLAFGVSSNQLAQSNYLIQLLSMPNLECLIMTDLSIPQLPTVRLRGTSKFSGLQTLQLRAFNFPTRMHDVDLFSTFPKITHLQLIDTTGAICLLKNIHRRSANDVFDELTADSTSDGPRWPNLNVITFGSLEGCNYEDLASTILETIKAGTPLRKIRVCHECEIEGNFPVGLAMLREQIEVEMINCDMHSFPYQYDTDSSDDSESDESYEDEGSDDFTDDYAFEDEIDFGDYHDTFSETIGSLGWAAP
jgi:hypothetical protein